MIDWGKVSELSDEIGAEDFAEVVELFLEEVDETIGVLATGVPEGKMEETLHFLKGSAMNLGFTDFARLCALGEQAAAKGDFAVIDTARICDCYASSKAQFLAEWESRLAA